MKVALIVPGGVDRSGQHRVIPAVLALLRRLTARHTVHVFALSQEEKSGRWLLHGAHVHNIGRKGLLPTPIRAIGTVLNIDREVDFDIVHSIWSGSCGFVAVTAAKFLAVPSIVHIAGGELTALPQIGYGGRLRWRHRALEALTLRMATVVTAASAPIIAQVAAHGQAARRIPLGVDLEQWPMRAPVRRDPLAAVRLVHIASLNRVKDQTTLLHALQVMDSKGAPFHLDIVGEDTLRGEIQSLSQRLGLNSKVQFHGFLTQQQMRPLIEQAHINVVSSLHEAGPLVVLEAATVGVPTVGTAVGHLVEWASEAALVVAIGDANGLASAIERVATDEELRFSLASEAQRRACREDAEYTFGCFDALYAELMTTAST